MKDTWILHVDGDNFFASCEIAWQPQLKGRPVVVGQERGIACAMSREAKALGITRAMPIFKIRDQFPQVTILPSHFELYEAYSRNLCALLAPEVDILEKYSIDECFAEVSASTWEGSSPAIWLKTLKKSVQSALGVTYSFSLARTKVLAKIASKHQKPDGCTYLAPDDETAVLEATDITSVWGVGRALSRRFERLRVKTAHQFSQWSEERVEDSFSLPTKELWHELRGKRMFAVGSAHEDPKSLQSTKSFALFSSDFNFIVAELLHNLDVAFSRMRSYGLATRRVSVFLKTNLRHYYGGAIELAEYTDNVLDAVEQVAALTRTLFKNGVRYKATGVSIFGLRRTVSLSTDLFGFRSIVAERGKVMETVDAIRDKHGQGSVTLLSSLPSAKDRLKKSAILAQTDTYLYNLPFPFLGEVT